MNPFLSQPIDACSFSAPHSLASLTNLSKLVGLPPCVGDVELGNHVNDGQILYPRIAIFLMKSTSQTTGFWIIGLAMLAFACHDHSPCQAQISEPRVTSATDSRVATLEELLINQLRATTEERKAYVRMVVQHTTTGELDPRLVVAIQRYASRKNPQFPFPYFERAMRFEAEKRGIELPPVQLLAGSRSTYTP
jgi:hypothetical protein